MATRQFDRTRRFAGKKKQDMNSHRPCQIAGSGPLFNDPCPWSKGRLAGGAKGGRVPGQEIENFEMHSPKRLAAALEKWERGPDPQRRLSGTDAVSSHRVTPAPAGGAHSSDLRSTPPAQVRLGGGWMLNQWWGPSERPASSQP